jgi:hypothetical protein
MSSHGAHVPPPGYTSHVAGTADFDASENGARPQSGAAALNRLDLAAILASDPPEHEWVWEGYLERGTLAVLHGDGGTGKSILTGALTRAMTLGGSCLDQGTTQGRVLIFDGENPLPEIARRLHRLGFTLTTHDRLTYVRASEPILTGELDQLRELILELGPLLVILDSQRALWDGDEREANEVRALYRRLQAIAEQTSCAILLIHHDRRTGGYSGTSDVNNAVDTRLWLERPDPEQLERVLHHAKARSSLELPKASYTFTLDPTLGLYTFTQPLQPRTTRDDVRDALTDDWQVADEIATTAGARKIDVQSTLRQLTREGVAEHAVGPPGRSRRAKCWRYPSGTRDGSGRVAQPSLSENPSPDGHTPLGGCPPDGYDSPNPSHTRDRSDLLDPDEHARRRDLEDGGW